MSAKNRRTPAKKVKALKVKSVTAKQAKAVKGGPHIIFATGGDDRIPGSGKPGLGS